jgi:hypothetical protein
MNVPRLSTLPSEMFDYLYSLKFHHSAESSKRAATLSLRLFLSGFGTKKKLRLNAQGVPGRAEDTLQVTFLLVKGGMLMQTFRMYEIRFYVNFRKNNKHFPLQITWPHTTLRSC